MSEQPFRPPYRVDEVAERFGITPYQVRGAAKRGELSSFRIGKTLLIRAESVDRLLAGDNSTASDVAGDGD